MEPNFFSSAVVKFSAKFCNELDKSNNVVSSPLSAEYLLALLTLGTTEPAHSELLTSLEFPNDESICSSFKPITTKLKSIQGVTLNIANKVYLNNSPYDLYPKLKEAAIDVFDASFEKINFSDGPGSADTINKWVEGKTNNRIKELLSSDSINCDTRVVLVNALYFKGNWKNQFLAYNTTDQPFHIDSQTTVVVPMMYQEENYRYTNCPDLQAKILEMAYEGEQSSMVIVLPNEIEGLDGVLQKLADGFDLMGQLDNMISTKVQVTLPKFKIETEIDLKDVLPKLGIKAIFNCQNSGLTNILERNEHLSVSKAVQKAFIEVNEEGAEAAAATAVIMVRKRINKAREFRANRPALYCIFLERQLIFMTTYRRPMSPCSSPTPRSEL